MMKAGKTKGAEKIRKRNRRTKERINPDPKMYIILYKLSFMAV